MALCSLLLSAGAKPDPARWSNVQGRVQRERYAHDCGKVARWQAQHTAQLAACLPARLLPALWPRVHSHASCVLHVVWWTHCGPLPVPDCSALCRACMSLGPAPRRRCSSDSRAITIVIPIIGTPSGGSSSLLGIAPAD